MKEHINSNMQPSLIERLAPIGTGLFLVFAVMYGFGYIVGKIMAHLEQVKEGIS